MPHQPRAQSKRPPRRSDSTVGRCPVVGVGASAGGLEAFSDLLKHLSASTGFAFVFIQHLDPKHPSRLQEIFARATKMPVAEAADGMRVEANHVYIIPPAADLSIAGDVLCLTQRIESSGRHLPIDAFFRSLAAECKSRAIGIVLSGNATDGTLGLRAIKEAGGIALAQDETSARYAGMPRSAAASGCVDFILPPEKIAAELIRISAHPLQVSHEETLPPEAADGLDRIFSLVRAATGVDFSQYKRTTIQRRIQRRLIVHRFDQLDEYADYLQKHPREIEALYREALIHVTSFFREPETFAMLAKTVYPALARNRPAGESIRVWLPGCSTGEEAYSIAISLAEFFEDAADGPPIQIFGTDVSDQVVDFARKGVFDETIEADVSPGRLKRFFTKVDRGWRINKAIRDLCIFARQNVLKDSPFSKLDLVSCRNVLIYFEQAAQKKLLPLFHYSLRAEGFLLLGSAESIGAYPELFESVDQKIKVFAKRPFAGPPIFGAVGEQPSRNPPPAPGPEKEIWSRLDVQKEADRVLLARFCPPALVVGDHLEIIQFRGRVAPFLEPAAGDATLNLFRMLRPAIEIELRTALTRVRKTGALVRRENVRYEIDGRLQAVHLEVIPLGSAALREPAFIVIFEDPPIPAARPSPRLEAGPKAARGRTEQLEQDLAASKEHLQSVIEEHEATTEELRSASEEIQASNEELQSMNEELETAKEELQSINEELTTVNEELKHSNRDLSEVNNDLGNLLRSVNLPIVMLGRDLRIRRFTPVAQKIFKLLPSDVGRAITDLRPDLEIPELEKIIHDVIETLGTREIEVRHKDGRWYLLTVRPYETTDHKITGVVLVLFDIDASKHRVDQADLAATYASAFLETVRANLLVLDADGRVKRATESFYKTFGFKPRKTEGRALYELGDGQWNVPELRALLEDILPKKTRVHDFALAYDLPHAGRKRLILNARRLERDIEGKPLILLSVEELPLEEGA